MTEVRDCVVGRPVHLSLQEAYAIIQLVCHVQGLVGSYATFLDEGRVVATDLGDVAVFALAQLRVVVARLSVGDGWC